MKTIIHVGQHKTGTSSIQQFLRDHKQSLARKGLYVPESIAGFNFPSHSILNAYCLSENRSSTLKDKLIESKGREFLVGLDAPIRSDIKKHYEEAEKQNCKDVIWTNEGLYLLNSIEEYNRLYDLFTPYSSEVVVVCCFRKLADYKESYIKQLLKQKTPFSKDKDSYRYVEDDSWLFDYKAKKDLLLKTFDDCYFFDYSPEDNVSKFMSVIGYPSLNSQDYRYNVTENQIFRLIRAVKNRGLYSTSKLLWARLSAFKRRK